MRKPKHQSEPDVARKLESLSQRNNKLMNLREEYQKETGKDAILKAEHLSIPTLNYIIWLENKIIQNKKEEIYHSLNCHECNLESEYVLAKDGCNEDWSVIKLIEVNKEKANYPFFYSNLKNNKGI